MITMVVGFWETLRNQWLWSFSLEETHTDAHLTSTSISFEDLSEITTARMRASITNYAHQVW